MSLPTLLQMDVDDVFDLRAASEFNLYQDKVASILDQRAAAHASTEGLEDYLRDTRPPSLEKDLNSTDDVQNRVELQSMPLDFN